MNRYIFLKALVVLLAMFAEIAVLTLLASCSFNPPPNTGAYQRSITETKESKARPAPVAVPQAYPYFTNASYDRLVESHTIQPPPTPPGHGPVPVFVAAPAVSNMFTAKVLPKLLVTNQIPGSMILSRITTTDKDGKKFTATLEMHGEQTIQANGKMAVLIFSIHHKDYQIEFCTNLTDGVWHPMTSGTGQDTNSALILVDLYPTNQPIKFYRQKKLTL